jgi:endonuclease YncB( thermonuclease family)
MNYKKILVFFLIILGLSLLSIIYPHLIGQTILKTSGLEYEKEPAVFKRVVDGDTIKVYIGEKEETIRLLGVNTPEKGQIGYEGAKNFLYTFENKSIFLLRDKEDSDRYDRKLRYLFYGSRLINVEILENGLAIIYMADGLKYEDKLTKAEKYASGSGLGLWKRSESQCRDCFELVELNAKDEYFILKNKCNIKCIAVAFDEGNHKFSIALNGNGEKMFKSNGKVWNDDKDRFFLRDESGLLVVYEYDNLMK